MRKAVTGVLGALILGATLSIPLPVAHAGGTPDGQTPAQEKVCDDAHLARAAYGLCIAFCEAGDCDRFPKRPSCANLRRNFTKQTGLKKFPCEQHNVD